MAALKDTGGGKHQHHLDLLREQYVKLQQRHSELEQKYSQALSVSGTVGPDHFVSKLLSLTADLYDKSLYSDIEIVLRDRKMCGHRFVLACRSRRWNQDETLSSTSELDLSHMTPFVAGSMIRWVYTDSIILPSDQDAMIELLSATNTYHLPRLKEKCEHALISTVTVRNCIKLYQTSEEYAAQKLKAYCLQIISSHWDNLNTSDFAELSAPLLYDMFKAHTSYPLHLAIQHLREDVVFLFLIEHNAQLPQKLNDRNDEGYTPLNLALLNRHEEIANTLVSHKCDLDIQDDDGNSLLHLAILRGDSFAASFLIKSGANTILANRNSQETPLHMVAAYDPSKALTNVSTVSVREAPWPSETLGQIASLLLEYHANPDSQDASGYTPLQRALECKNMEVFTILLTNPVLNLDLRNNDGSSALWLALQQLDSTFISSEDPSEYEHTFAARLIKRGSNPDAVDTRTGNSLLHRAALECNEGAAIFLVYHRAVPNHRNVKGETPIHIAAQNGLHKLVAVLLQKGADPNVQTDLKPKVKLSQIPPSSLSLSRSDAMGLGSRAGTPMGSSHNLETALTSLEGSSSPMSTRMGNGGANNFGGFVGEGALSPSTIGALNALSFTSQALSGYSVASNTSGYGSMVGSGVITPSPRESRKNQTLNPFGSDSDDEADRPPTPATASGYSVTPINPQQQHQQHPGEGIRRESRDNSARSSPSLRMTGRGNAAPSPLSRGVSVESPPPPKLGSDLIEFIELPELFDVSVDPGASTALHLAIAHSHSEVVDVLLNHKGNSGSGKLEIDLNVNLRDGNNETPLSLSLWTDQFNTAHQLLTAGADIECVGRDDPGLLYVAIVREKSRAAMFLLENGADCKKRSPNNESLLLLAIKHKLEAVVDHLCEALGTDLFAVDSKGNNPLWVALRSRQESVASKLVIHGCDPNAWHTALGGDTINLLHRSILLMDTMTACFLIRNAVDINSSTRPAHGPSSPSLSSSVGPEGARREGGPGDEGYCFSPPLHMACERGLHEIVRCLVDHHANINAKDSMGRSCLHVSISRKERQCSDILLSHPDLDLTIKDKSGNSPFAKAMAVKDNEAGLAILKREPKAAEQVDSRGQNFLHLAVLNQDVEGVIFLLSVRVDINSKVQGPTLNTPLHYAVKGGSEILTRHLLLAGARVSAIDNHQRGAIHMAVEGDYSTILSVLTEHAADPDIADENGNNGLHLALQLGHIACARVLLEESNINLLATNQKGENCLHLLARHAKENAAAIFHMLIEVAPGFPINKQDSALNTPILSAYIGGSMVLCDALIKAGAHPGIQNRQGLSIFNTPVATKQMLFRILDQIHTEPVWLDGNSCFNCNLKFNISHRKHHCRHCGRLLCKQCTNHQVPILKFDLSRPMRVCEVCADSFSLVASR